MTINNKNNSYFVVNSKAMAVLQMLAEAKIQSDQVLVESLSQQI